MTGPNAPQKPNRLSAATSPYLQQHANNPVDWYEWGPEALRRARDEDKPIFLSIGYSACHWCHVMAHESFESAAVAEVLNRHFVSIKVDREERPDLDEIYMQATMILNQGQGGWPMSVFLTPELKPFFAGTYFPPESRWGRPGFRELSLRIAEFWTTRRAALLADADKLTEYLVEHLASAQPGEGAITLSLIDRTADLLARAFDEQRGGMLSGGTNKFPPSMALGLMLRSARRGRDEPARARVLLERVQTTLDHMAAGGIFDHLAGGIARYSTDPDWLVPHFEKMLYDQALVGRAYVEGYLVTQRPDYARNARAIFDYVLSDLQSPAGGFYSARDADSEGEEGKYYVWTQAEILAALGPDAGPRFCSYYDVSESGNWSDPHAPGVAKNILHTPRDLATVARLNQVDAAQLEQELADGRARLLALRAARVPPLRDEKILAEWNGLMIASLAFGGAALDEPRYVQAAARAAEAVLSQQVREGRLLRSYRDGRASQYGFLSDYACMIEGLLELYEATFDARWLQHAVELNQAAIRLHADERDGGFFFTASDHETLLARTKDLRDSAVPSGNSVQLMNLLRLASILGDARLRELAERSMTRLGAQVLANPGAGERFLAAAEFALAGPIEIAVVGPPDDPRTQRLARVARSAYLPNRVLMGLDPNEPGKAFPSPLLRDRTLVNGRPAAYVCRNYVCQLPFTDADALQARLAE